MADKKLFETVLKLLKLSIFNCRTVNIVPLVLNVIWRESWHVIRYCKNRQNIEVKISKIALQASSKYPPSHINHHICLL